jgi:hypothetical protein
MEIANRRAVTYLAIILEWLGNSWLSLLLGDVEAGIFHAQRIEDPFSS